MECSCGNGLFKVNKLPDPTRGIIIYQVRCSVCTKVVLSKEVKE